MLTHIVIDCSKTSGGLVIHLIYIYKMYKDATAIVLKWKVSKFIILGVIILP